MSDFEIEFRGATLTVSGSVEKPDGEQPYFVLEEVRCGDQDISEIVEAGSDQWLAIEDLCNLKESPECDGQESPMAAHRGERAWCFERYGESPVR